MVTVITGTTTKPMSSEQLKNFFQSHLNLEGYLYRISYYRYGKWCFSY